MLSAFCYGRNQHVRRICSSIVSVIHYVSTRVFLSCDVMEDGRNFSGSATSPFFAQNTNIIMVAAYH